MRGWLAASRVLLGAANIAAAESRTYETTYTVQQ